MLINQGFLIKGRKQQGLKLRIEVKENETYTLPISGATKRLMIDWGDGLIKRYPSSLLEAPSHSYAKAGRYVVHISGMLEKFDSYNYSSQAEREVLSMGNDFQVKFQVGMFGNCQNLSKVNLSGYQHFNTMRLLFWKSPMVETITMEDTLLDKITIIDNMFTGLGENMSDFRFLSGFKNVRNASFMFQSSSSKHVDLSHFDVSKVENIAGMFDGCANLEQITFPQNQWSNASSCSYFAFNASKLTSSMPPELFWEKEPAFSSHRRAFLGARNIENFLSIPRTWKE